MNQADLDLGLKAHATMSGAFLNFILFVCMCVHMQVHMCMQVHMGVDEHSHVCVCM